MGASKTRLLLLAGAAVLFVLLYFAPRTAPLQNEAVTETTAANENLDVYVKLAQKNVAPELGKQLAQLEKTRRYDSIALFWDQSKRPDIASYYVELQAVNTNVAADWFKAGNRYYYAVQFCQDQTEAPVLYQCAMRCFKKGLATDPGNTDARIMLASCLVEGSPEPMKGITQLREIEKTDSNNVKLQLTFAFFSVKSGQAAKAIERFNKVLRIDSTYIAAYLHLADAYEQQGDTEKTIAMLRKYAMLTDDAMARLEIEKYIKQLSTQ